jgi:lysophospholipid acyltransferase (LPLAT)-like uncharacterized protein
MAEALKFSAPHEQRHPISHYDAQPRPMPLSRRLRARLLENLGVAAARVIGPTLSYEAVGWQHPERVYASGRRCVYAFWHRSIFLAMWLWRDRGIVCMTSANFDGQILGRAIQRFGYRVTYGSSSRGGLRGLAELAREIEQGRDSAFAADGPRGPRYVAKAGYVLLARRTRCPIICFHLRAQHNHTFDKSWDHAQLPHPFSRVVLAMAPPIEVPEDADRDMIDQKHAELQQRLEQARDLAESWFTLPAAERERQRAIWNA